MSFTVSVEQVKWWHDSLCINPSDSFLLSIRFPYLLIIYGSSLSLSFSLFLSLSLSFSLTLSLSLESVSLKLSSITRCVFRNPILFHLDSFRHLLKLISLLLSLPLSHTRTLFRLFPPLSLCAVKEITNCFNSLLEIVFVVISLLLRSWYSRACAA